MTVDGASIAEIGEAIPAFAGPFSGNTDSASVLAEEYAKHWLRETAENIAGRPGFARTRALLEEIINNGLPRSGWTWTVGRARHANMSGVGDLSAISVNLVLEYVESCRPASFSCVFEGTRRIVLGPVIFPETEQLSVEWSPPVLHVATRQFEGQFMVKRGACELVRFDSGTAQTWIGKIGAGVLRTWERSDGRLFAPLGIRPVRLPAETVVTLSDAARLLVHHLPEYHAWIHPVIASIVPVPAPDDGFLSGSDCRQHGVISVSFPIDPLSLVESLVHEAAHQYLFLLGSFIDLTDPDHTGTYFSPLRGCDRPIDKILLAYHASANIVCCHRLLLSRHSRIRPTDAALEGATSDCELLASHLSGNPALTRHGRILVRAIQQHVSSL